MRYFFPQIVDCLNSPYRRPDNAEIRPLSNTCIPLCLRLAC